MRALDRDSRCRGAPPSRALGDALHARRRAWDEENGADGLFLDIDGRKPPLRRRGGAHGRSCPPPRRLRPAGPARACRHARRRPGRSARYGEHPALLVPPGGEADALRSPSRRGPAPGSWPPARRCAGSASSAIGDLLDKPRAPLSRRFGATSCCASTRRSAARPSRSTRRAAAGLSMRCARSSIPSSPRSAIVRRRAASDRGARPPSSSADGVGARGLAAHASTGSTASRFAVELGLAAPTRNADLYRAPLRPPARPARRHDRSRLRLRGDPPRRRRRRALEAPPGGALPPRRRRGRTIVRSSLIDALSQRFGRDRPAPALARRKPHPGTRR